MISRLTIGVILAFGLVALPASAETPEEKGLRIAIEADAEDTGFGDYEVAMVMVLRNRHGEESVRNFRTKTLEVADDGDKSLAIFDEPADIKGTALLTYSHKTGSDDQWLYLPALKRVKRISSENKSGSFVGSEFAYEDLSSQEVEKYTYRWLADEPCPGADELTCWLIERIPVDESSGYTRQHLWIDQPEYRPWKIDFYDRKDSLLKTLTFADYREYLGRYWRAHEMRMVNHQTGKSTDLTFEDYAFRTGLSDRDFDQKALSRAR
jgi:outer membrane lipoprotein-sorting protein